MLTIDEIASAARTASSGLPVRRVYLFGSRARGQGRPDSDVDLILDTMPDFSLMDLASFKNKVEELLGVAVDVASERSLLPPVRAEARRDRVLIHEQERLSVARPDGGRVRQGRREDSALSY